MNKKNKSVMLLITAILTYLTAVVCMLVAVCLAFNTFKLADIYIEILKKYAFNTTNMSSQVTMLVIELGFIGLVNVYFGNYYSKAYKYRVNNKEFGQQLIRMSIFQVLLMSFLPAITGIIGGVIMIKRKPIKTGENGKQTFFNDYKLNAMSEAVIRLKELRQKGIISEEEYYANLNKILEG